MWSEPASDVYLDPRDSFNERPFPLLGPEERGKDGGGVSRAQ